MAYPYKHHSIRQNYMFHITWQNYILYGRIIYIKWQNDLSTHTCLSDYVSIFTYACMHAYIYTYICIYVKQGVCVPFDADYLRHMYTYICLCICVVYTYVCMYMYVYIYVYIYIHIYVYVVSDARVSPSEFVHHTPTHSHTNKHTHTPTQGKMYTINRGF